VRDGTEDDEALAVRAASGDAGALDELLRRHTQLVHGVCRRVLANADDALDATQEALLLIARKIHTFDGRARFTTWCYRVATNAALDEARRRNRRPLATETLSEPVADGPGDDSRVADRLDLDAALGRLSPDYRAAVALRDIVGMDYAEIADVLGVPAGTVRSRISRGRAALADILGNPEPTSKRQTPRAP
jgi:RNA polymerase sigma-70 factor, ECF subfamily